MPVLPKTFILKSIPIVYFMEDFYQIVRSIYPVSDPVLSDMCQYVHGLSLSKGDLLIREGTCDSRLYFIRKGLLRSYHWDGDREDTLWFATEGDAVASMHARFCNQPAIANIEALVSTSLYFISRTDLDSLFDRHHELANWGRRLAEEELYCLERRYGYVGCGDAYSRYCAFMRMRPVDMIQEIPLKYVASYLGIAPQTLSKLRLRYAYEK